MRITTWNVNGLRAALRKGFGDCLAQLAPDVLLLQEIRCTPEQLPAQWAAPVGWHVHWQPAQRPGYAGTAIWSRTPLEVLSLGLDDGGGDPDGRVIAARVDGVIVASVYCPPARPAPNDKRTRTRGSTVSCPGPRGWRPAARRWCWAAT